MLLDHDEPMNYEEATMRPDSDRWLEAMKCEIGSMYENKVWTLVDLPDDRQAIENKWIFKKNTTLMVMSLSTKLELSQKFFDKFKVLTTMRFSHSYRCLKSVRIMLELLHFMIMKSGKWM